jgi:hypothetical protein
MCLCRDAQLAQLRMPLHKWAYRKDRGNSANDSCDWVHSDKGVRKFGVHSGKCESDSDLGENPGFSEAGVVG